jgi:hypothetical protein
MIAMQMGDEHGVDLVRLDAKPTHADERRCPAIDEKSRLPRAHVKGGVEAAAGAESIAAADDGQSHGGRILEPRVSAGRE